MPKYDAICKLMEKRIQHGDYITKDFPAEERLAAEMGVSRMTARRAVLQLLNRGVLIRKPNGRVSVNRERSQGTPRLQIALLMPAFISSVLERWRVGAEQHALLLGPNSGWSEAGTAGAIQRRIVGPIWLDGVQVTDRWIGDPSDPLLESGTDVTRAMVLAVATGLVATAVAALAIALR